MSILARLHQLCNNLLHSGIYLLFVLRLTKDRLVHFKSIGKFGMVKVVASHTGWQQIINTGLKCKEDTSNVFSPFLDRYFLR